VSRDEKRSRTADRVPVRVRVLTTAGAVLAGAEVDLTVF